MPPLRACVGLMQAFGVMGGKAMEFTKSERRQLRELAGEVYESEAHSLIEDLDNEFARWRDGEILSSELLTAIHEFTSISRVTCGACTRTSTKP